MKAWYMAFAECPECGSHDGDYWCSKTLWRYCRQHRIAWIFGHDLGRVVDLARQRRIFYELGVEDFDQAYKREYEALMSELPGADLVRTGRMH